LRKSRGIGGFAGTLSMDTLTPEQRSKRMAAIRGTNTKPELAVRRALHRAGYRYRLHEGRLPGRPDLVFASRRKVIFVHGCFWHQHKGCRTSHIPKSRTAYWAEKLDANAARDSRNIAALKASGWSVLVLWECQTKRLEVLVAEATAFLGPARLD
jgi:DNA mismatch endonuclease (patch repair protein)